MWLKVEISFLPLFPFRAVACGSKDGVSCDGG